jgi:NADH-quinone oxidoreductase subunit M
MLTLYKRSFFGPITNEANRDLPDLTKQELTALLPLVFLVVLLGVYPKPILDPIDNSVKHMLVNMEAKTITQDAKDLLHKATRIGEAK